MRNFLDSCEFGSLHYFALCGLGGVISCGTTHTMVNTWLLHGFYNFY